MGSPICAKILCPSCLNDSGDIDIDVTEPRPVSGDGVLGGCVYAGAANEWISEGQFICIMRLKLMFF